MSGTSDGWCIYGLGLFAGRHIKRRRGQMGDISTPGRCCSAADESGIVQARSHPAVGPAGSRFAPERALSGRSFACGIRPGTVHHMARALVFCAAVVAIMSAAAPASAQADLSGVWQPRYHEDLPERIPGPELRDYLGLPINDAARQFADSWDPSRITLPEEQCRVQIGRAHV